MHKFSRWMPPAPHGSRSAMVFVAPIALVVAWLVVRFPWILVIAGIVFVAGAFLDRHRLARLRAMAVDRQGESLCSFARTFPRGARDPWILRAVYDELSQYYTVDRQIVPLRPTDRLWGELEIDPEDLEMSVATIAGRVGCDLTIYRNSPYDGPLNTVADLVMLLRSCPRRVAA